jgi:hypothetical protein
MYEDLDKYLNGALTLDYWYDEGFLIAREMLEKFQDEDWAKLQVDILSKPIDWRVKFAYCTDRGINDGSIVNILVLLSDTDSDELFEACVDALRVFASSNFIGLKPNENRIVHRIEEMLPNLGMVPRKMFEDFVSKVRRSEDAD